MHETLPRRRFRIRPALIAPALVTLMAVALIVAASQRASRADDPPKPKSADSRPFFKPKSAVFSTSVEPAHAKAGDIVAFKATVKLSGGAHIYKYSKEQPAGPINTTFDFFDPAGLKIEGDWAPSEDPQKHKDPNFADLEFVEYHEDEVTWSIKLKIPEGTAPGKKVLRCQAKYQVCDAKSCSIPGQWTLPDAVLTIVGADEKVPETAAASKPARSQTSAPAAPKPDQNDNPPATASSAANTQTQTANASEKPTAAAAPGALAPGASTAGVESEIAQKAQQGLIPFLLASALGGLFALVMPCVWPMVPITVNFFVKQGQGAGGQSKATGLAIIYCLSIIGVFTAVGVFFSFFFSASTLQTLANKWWVNLIIAGLFIAFGLSLLGLFEMRLPNFLLNASAQRESKGGLVGVMFMALTLTITSFTCTFPVVGGLLVMAAGGDFLYPIIGLATFAAVLALPFFLLALSPSLISKMPRSGDWMNAVKVVGGLVEIGAALKFINTAELAWVSSEKAWINAQVVLTAWVVLSVVCGAYLLGLFRTDHDHDEVKVGPGRLVAGCLFLALALYMAPALFGHVPRGVVWNRLIVGILPPDARKLATEFQLAAGGDASLRDVKATSTNPAEAERQEKRVHGVVWGLSFDQAKEMAAAQKKPILIDFTGVNCPNCRAMEAGVFPQPEVVDLLKKFVTVQLYTDFVDIDSLTPEQRHELAAANQDRIIQLANENTNPCYVVLSPTGEVLARIGGYNEPPRFVDFLSKALAKLPEQVGSSETKPAKAASLGEDEAVARLR